MNQQLIIDLIALGPVSASVLFLVMRFYRRSILYKIGLSSGLMVLFLLNITILGKELSENPYPVLVPVATLTLVIFFRYLNKHIRKPIMAIQNVFMHLKEGDLEEIQKLNIKSKDEYGDISDSANKLIDGFSNMTDFAFNIGRGNLDIDYEVLGEKDSLGKSLLEMQQSLIDAKEKEVERKRNEEIQLWTNEGFAQFGDLLRNENSDTDNFYYSIITHLVNYVECNQGGMFLVNNDDPENPFIEMVSCYAYQRKKYTNKRFEMGESLVGQCILEGESIYMTDIPQGYIHITSGLGDATPGALLLVPLKFNDTIYGVIEIASFKEFDPYKIRFVERVAESIASTISTYKVNQKTVKLLEDSKIQSEELAAQEEEIRQNMEELQTTQEESARREAEMSNTLDAVKANTLMAELDLKGRVLEINDAYARLFATTNTSALGSSWTQLVTENEDDNFAQILEQVQNGDCFNRIVKVNTDEEIYESYALVKDSDGYPHKIINVAMILPN